MTEIAMIGTLIVALVALTGLAVNYAKLKKNFQEDVDKGVSDKMAVWHEKLASLERDLKRIEEAFAAEVEHLKENHESKIANLAEKIDALRDEVRSGQTQLVQLLTKLVSERK